MGPKLIKSKDFNRQYKPIIEEENAEHNLQLSKMLTFEIYLPFSLPLSNQDVYASFYPEKKCAVVWQKVQKKSKYFNGNNLILLSMIYDPSIPGVNNIEEFESVALEFIIKHLN